MPKLELCGAWLLSHLVSRVIKSMRLTTSISEIVLFSDSTIVLNWLDSEPSKWKAFVSNRVGEIQRLTDGATWLHVNSQSNPADIISRGSDPDVLKCDKL